MTRNIKKRSRCNYCLGVEGVQVAHTFYCPFNPKNNKKIIEYLTYTFNNSLPLNANRYNKWAKLYRLPTSVTLFNLFYKNGWLPQNSKPKDIFPILIYRSYALNLIHDLETLDILVYQQTYGNMGFERQPALDADVNDQIYQNYMSLASVILSFDV